MRHFLEVDDLSEVELRDVLDLSDPARAEPVLAGRGVALIFEKPSNRTRNSTEMAVVGLGGHPVTIRGEEIGLGERETVEDVTRALACYHAMIGARVFEHDKLEAMAKVDEVPIVNLLSDLSHPLQAVADLLTLKQRWGGLAGHSVAWIGDASNVARSLTLASSLCGVDVRLACPPGHELEPPVLDQARSRGIEVVVTPDPEEAAAGADAVCTDVWVSMGQEAEAAARQDAFGAYRVTAELMSRAAPGALFLHCLPAHRGLEVDTEVLDGPASVVWQEAENRMHAARGLLLWLAGQR
ncbi:MAG: ornithine carbamoyltransferase [Acidimicrobiales bacterium]|nr:ornithine carbamoyltransferase [Acidimicrobiales bacterium]